MAWLTGDHTRLTHTTSSEVPEWRGTNCSSIGALDAVTNWAKVVVEEAQAKVFGRLADLRDLKSTHERIPVTALSVCSCQPLIAEGAELGFGAPTGFAHTSCVA